MASLDNLLEISKLDPGNILASIEHLPEQIKQIWAHVNYLAFPESYKNTQNIVVCGMGGSALGGRIIHSLMFNNLTTPIEVVTGYKLPHYVNENSLVILSSYSGNTEETVEAAHDAIKKNAKIVGVATGGKLAEILKKDGKPVIVFETKNNPSNQPRMGLGYSIAGILAILTKCKHLNITHEQMEEVIATTEKFVSEYGVRSESSKNIAKSLAKQIRNRGIAFIASEHLVGSAHAFKNQINENAKTFSAIFEISEANHHLMEGLKFPLRMRDSLHFLFLESKNYYERNLKRYKITQDVVDKQRYGFSVYKTISETKLEEVFEILVLGSYVSFYLAILNDLDPSPIPWVDYFKEKLA